MTRQTPIRKPAGIPQSTSLRDYLNLRDDVALSDPRVLAMLQAKLADAEAKQASYQRPSYAPAGRPTRTELENALAVENAQLMIGWLNAELANDPNA